MTTQHFNKLSEAQAERLALLIEECAEVQAMACKILRHGYESRNPLIEDGLINKRELEKEIGHVTHAVDMLVQAGDLDMLNIQACKRDKQRSIARWLHHQISPLTGTDRIGCCPCGRPVDDSKVNCLCGRYY